MLIAGVAAMALYGGRGGFMGMMGMGSVERHRVGMMGSVPPPYGGRINPLPITRELLDRGAALYRIHCSVCHGPEGRGDGATAAGLDPPPADLARLVRMPIANDDYLLWALSEGGARFGSVMPAFKESLSETQLWQIIGFLRRLRP